MLKVFYGDTMATVDGDRRFRDVIMATTSQKKFMEATGAARGFFSITRNDCDVATAMAEPETIFVNQNGGNWPKIWIRPDK